MGPPREVAACGNCLMCDTYFMLVVRVVPPASSFSGREGTKKFETLLENIQKELEAERGCMNLRCPTCTELANGLTFLQILSSIDHEAVTTVCRLVVWEDGEFVPLYLNAADPVRKPRWQIVQGVGPPAFELDKTLSGRVYKPTLRQFGVATKPWDREEANLSPAEYRRMVDAMEAFWGAAGDAKVREAVEGWWEMRPLFARWAEVEGELPGLSGVDDFEWQVEMRTECADEGAGRGGGGGGGAETLEEALEKALEAAPRVKRSKRRQ